MLWGVAACSRPFPGFTGTKPMQTPTNPWNHRTTKPTCMSMKPSTKPMKPNPGNWETRETTKLMKSQNPGHTKSSHEITLSWWNLLLRNLRNLWKPRRGRPSGSKSRVNSVKYWTPRNLSNHKIMKPWNVETIIPTINTLNQTPWRLWSHESWP